MQPLQRRRRLSIRRSIPIAWRFATEDGDAISEEMVLPMLADYLLPHGAGKLVITNVSTTALVDDVVARHGGEVVRVAGGAAGRHRRALDLPPGTDCASRAKARAP